MKQRSIPSHRSTIGDVLVETLQSDDMDGFTHTQLHIWILTAMMMMMMMFLRIRMENVIIQVTQVHFYLAFLLHHYGFLIAQVIICIVLNSYTYHWITILLLLYSFKTCLKQKNIDIWDFFLLKRLRTRSLLCFERCGQCIYLKNF